MRIALALFIGLLPAAGFAATPQVRHFETRSGLQFFAGDTLRIFDVGADSIFAAGGTVDVRGGAPDHIFAVGRRVRLIDTGSQDVFLAGREVTISGTVKDDVIAAGERVEADATAAVGGDAIYAGRVVRVAGTTKGDVIAAGGRVELAGIVDGDVNITSPDIVLTPGLRIGGALSYRSPVLLEIPDGVTIAGGLDRRAWPDEGAPRSEMAVGQIIASAVFGIVAFSMFAAAVLLAAPGAIHATTRQVQRAPWTAFGTGLAAAILLPICAVIISLTVIGLPLGLFLLAAGAVGFGVAAVVGWTWLGMRVFALTKHTSGTTLRAQMLYAALGVSLFVSAGFIPVAGFLAQAFVILMGYGAFVLAIHPSRRDAIKESPADTPA